MHIPLLSETLPSLWSLACDLADELRIGKYQSWQAINPRLQDLFSPELSKTCETQIPGWHKITTQRNGLTATHTLLVLAGCLNLPEYLSASPDTRHEIEWAAVLHDVDKNYNLHTNHKDASYPFRSAAVVARVLPRLGFLPQPDIALSDLEHWSALVMKSERQEDGRMVHDHSQLAEIIALLYQQWGIGTPASHILKAILFHQSLPTLKAWPNPVLLTDVELCTYLTIDDLDVLLPLLVADSDAWELFSKNRYASLNELRANNAETRQRFNQTVRYCL